MTVEEQEEGSELLFKGPCDACGSSDACAVYSDGHTHCFSCKAHTKGEGAPSSPTNLPAKRNNQFLSGEFKALKARGITEETCRKFGVKITRLKDGRVAMVLPYHDKDGALQWQKVRPPEKDDTFAIGDAKHSQFFGQHLWKAGGKKVVVTEGEPDCLSVSQVQGNKWATVSVTKGAAGAKKDFQNNLEWLETFDEVILCFDMDEPGQKAIQECAPLLSPGKVKVMRLPRKDANECLVAGEADVIINAMWNAAPWRPDGIVAGADLWDAISTQVTVNSFPYPWKGLTDLTLGLRGGEIVTLTAGSGVGKSQIADEIAYHLAMAGLTVGLLKLEQNVRRAALGMVGLHLNKRVHLPDVWSATPPTELKAAFDAVLGSGRFFLYDHFGSTDVDNLLSRIRYMRVALGCDFVVLDHLSIVVSGQEDGDERRLIDNLMTKLRTLVEETGVGMLLVSHLRRPNGDQGHEDGAEVSLAQLRGSHAIVQLSDMLIAAERDQRGKKLPMNVTRLRLLKNRFEGTTGVACYLLFDRETGRLIEIKAPSSIQNKQPAFEDEEDAPF